MNNSDYTFKGLLCDEIDKLYRDAQARLNVPATNDLSTSLHEIGLTRGYMKAMFEVYEICDEITKKLNDSERK